MVHALEEVWRALMRGGWMVDLRPVSTDWPLEVMTGDSPLRAGLVDGSLALADQVASDVAIEQVIDKGIFDREEHRFFELAYYWPSIEEMEDYVATSWKNSARIPSATLEEARRLVTLTGEQTEIRILRLMEIARYRRVDPTHCLLAVV